MNIENRKTTYINDDGILYEHIDLVQVNEDGTEVIRGSIDRPVEEELNEPSEDEIMEAEILINQMDIINKQLEQDEVLAEILLSQLGE